MHWRKYDSVKEGALRDFSAKGGGVSSKFSQILPFLLKNRAIFDNFYLFLAPKGGTYAYTPPPLFTLVDSMIEKVGGSKVCNQELTTGA